MNYHKKYSVPTVPLVIDLDGSLIRSDLLIEALFAFIGRHPLSIFTVLFALLRGKAALKGFLAERIDVDASLLPYDEDVIEEIMKARKAGRKTYLVSASNEKYVQKVADHLGLFDGCTGSSTALNLSGKAKAALLEREFGEGNFDYIGNSSADLEIWKIARLQICVRAPALTSWKVRRRHPDSVHLPSKAATIGQWLRLMRVHQWSKNALVGVAFFTSHNFTVGNALTTLTAFIAFSLCASSVYILNDQIDIAEDRAHRTKRFRPIAAGMIAPLHASLLAVALLASSMFVALQVSVNFLAVLIGYFLLTTAYSLWLKRKMLIDVVTLGLLYTIRILAGAVAIGVVLSEWLLAFSMFFFLSLALVKRYVELTARLDTGKPSPTNRNYKLDDLSIVAALAAAAGFNAVTVLTLWISSPAVHAEYSHARLLWLICPLFMYWIARILLMAHRRLMHDDPIVFAMKDKNSLLVGCLTGAIMLLAL